MGMQEALGMYAETPERVVHFRHIPLPLPTGVGGNFWRTILMWTMCCMKWVTNLVQRTLLPTKQKEQGPTVSPEAVRRLCLMQASSPVRTCKRTVTPIFMPITCGKFTATCRIIPVKLLWRVRINHPMYPLARTYLYLGKRPMNWWLKPMIPTTMFWPIAGNKWIVVKSLRNSLVRDWCQEVRHVPSHPQPHPSGQFPTCSECWPTSWYRPTLRKAMTGKQL